MSPRPIIAPTVTVTLRPGSGRSSTETHPAYALVRASRVSGSATLFGSDFQHQYFVTLAIARGEVNRDLSRDWFHARSDIIEVAMSEAQWATFISTLNVGMGTPCTLLYHDGRHVASIPDPPKRHEQFEQEMSANLAGARAQLAELRKHIESGKGGKHALDLIRQIDMSIGSSLVFVAKQFGEHIERTTERAKTEVSAWITNVISRLGLSAASKDSRPPISIENG